MNNGDIQAYDAASGRGRSRWPRRIGATALVLTFAFVLLLALVVGGSFAALSSLLDGPHHGWHVVINGEPWEGWLDWGDWSIGTASGAWVLLGLGVALLAVLVLVPLAVTFGLLMAGLGVAVALACSVGAVGLVLLVVLSPLWLIGLLLWLLLRRRTPAATMTA